MGVAARMSGNERIGAMGGGVGRRRREEEGARDRGRKVGFLHCGLLVSKFVLANVSGSKPGTGRARPLASPSRACVDRTGSPKPARPRCYPAFDTAVLVAGPDSVPAPPGSGVDALRLPAVGPVV